MFIDFDNLGLCKTYWWILGPCSSMEWLQPEKYHIKCVLAFYGQWWHLQCASNQNPPNDMWCGCKLIFWHSRFFICPSIVCIHVLKLQVHHHSYTYKPIFLHFQYYNFTDVDCFTVPILHHSLITMAMKLSFPLSISS